MAYKVEHQPPVLSLPEIRGTIPHFSPNKLSSLSMICPILPSERLTIPEGDQYTIEHIFRLADIQMAHMADIPQTDFTRVVTKEQAAVTRKASKDAVKALLLAEPNTVCIPLLFGAANLTRELMIELPQVDSIQDRILPFVVKRSSGMELTNAQVYTVQDAAHRIARASRVIIFDDILDKGGALATTAKIIAQIRGLLLSHSDMRIAKLLDLDRVDKEKAHHDLALLLDAAEIVYISPYSKNPELTEVLSCASYHQLPTPELRNHLENLIDLSPDDWVMGDHGIDTGVPWTTIHQHIEATHKRMLARPKIASLVLPLANALIRAGQSIDGLIAFSPQTPTLLPFHKLSELYSSCVIQAFQKELESEDIL